MPIPYKISLKDVSAVAASKTVVITCPRGPRYHQIILQHGYAAGTNTIVAAATNISEIRVKVNNRIQRRFSGTQLRDLILLNGTTYDAYTGEVPNTAPGVSFPLYFAEPWRDLPAMRDLLAWKTNLWSNFQIEIDLGAASTPTILGWAIVDDAVAQQPEAITKILPASIPAAGTKFDYTLPDTSGRLAQITLYPDSGASLAASPVTLRKGQVILHELTRTSNLAFLAQNGMTPDPTGRTDNVYDLVLDYDDLPDRTLPLDGTRDVTLTVEAASAMSGTITALIQRIGLPE